MKIWQAAVLALSIFVAMGLFWLINQQFVKYGGGRARDLLQFADNARSKNVLFTYEDSLTVQNIVMAQNDTAFEKLCKFVGYRQTTDSIVQRVVVLKNQYLQAGRYKRYFSFWIINYYATYYATTLTVILCTLITAILGFLIAFSGWQPTKPAVKLSFCCFFICSSFFGASSLVLQEKENGDKNTVEYSKANNLQIDIQSNVAMFAHLRPRVAKIDTYICYVATQLQGISLFNISIDASKYNLETYESRLKNVK